MEVVLADGKITRASRQRNPDLLSGLVGSLGVIAIATLFQIKLVPASKFVDLSYVPVESATEALELIKWCLRDPENDFVEGLIYDKKASSYGVIAIGRLAARRTHSKRRFSQPRDNYFYLHALEVGRTTESVEIADYIFRYDRASFCMGQYYFGRIPMNKWTRWLADSGMHSQRLTEMIHNLHWDEHFIMQDIVVPLEATNEVPTHLEDRMSIYPLQLRPIRQWPDICTIMRPHPRQTSLPMGIEIRGYTHDTIKNPVKFREKHREIEQIVHGCGCTKWLYSKSYYSEEELWNEYSREEYDALRKKYNANHLTSVYQMIKVREKRMKAHPKGFWNHVFARTSVLAMKNNAAKETPEKA